MVQPDSEYLVSVVAHTCQPADNVLDLGHFCLKMLLASPKCISINYGSGSHKKMRDLVIFVRDGYHFCLKSSRKLDGW